jgi:hypothetical protein
VFQNALLREFHGKGDTGLMDISYDPVLLLRAGLA